MSRPVPRTLRSRLTLLGVGAVAVWVAALTVVFNFLLSHELDNQADSLLRTRAQAAAATVVTAPGGGVSVRDPSDDEALDEGVWIYAGTTPLEHPARSPRQLQRLADQLAGTGPRFAERDGIGGARLYAHPVRAGGRQVATVVVSTSLTPYVRAERAALLGSLALGGLFVLGIWPAVRLVVGRALGPVHAMTHQAAQWSEHDLGRRFGPAPRPQELDELAGTLDGVLDRLAAAVRHEQLLTDELSHELRTPLARITAETDLLLGRPRNPEELRRSHESIAASATHLRDILETLLRTARAGIPGAAGAGSCDVHEVVATLLARSAAATPRLQSLVPPGTRAGVDAAVLDRILAPVVDNAVRYARSRVTVTAATSGRELSLCVTDDGPGIDPELRQAVFTPGLRGDPLDGHDGAGLGLALARRLATAADGTIDAVAPEGDGGAVVRVRLPLA